MSAQRKDFFKEESIDSTNFKLNLRLQYIRFYCGLGASIGAGFISHYASGFDIKESIALASAGIVATTLWYNATNLILNSKVNQKKMAFDRKVIATNMVGEWHKEFAEKSIICRDLINLHYFNTSPSSDQIGLVKTVDSDPRLRAALVPILNYFEKIAIAVDHGIADEEVIRDFFEDIFKRYYESFYPFILSRGTGPGGMPKAFVFFCAMTVNYGSRPQESS